MFYAVAIVFGVLGHLSSGVPLEDSSVHLPKPLVPIKEASVPIEKQLVLLEDPLVSQINPSVPLEDPSTDFRKFFNSRIVGGTEASKKQAPHMVGLVVGHTWKSFVCGASIISRCHILTAAHCVTSFIQWDGDLMDSLHARVGSNTWYEGSVIEFKGLHVHPDYDYWTIKNDVAILLTKDCIKLSKRVAIIPLNFDWVDGGEKSYVTGWGTEQLWGNLPSLLQILYVSTITPQECQKGISEANTVGWWIPHIDPKLEICTFHSPNHGMCHGDSGSALVSVKSENQIGIVSWGMPCAVGAPDVFVRITGMKKFIQDILKKGCDCCKH